MPKHDPPGDDAALLELERELMELDRAIRVAKENREAINYALFDRRDGLMARIEFPTKLVLSINMKTAKALGLEMPLQLQQLADKVIE